MSGAITLGTATAVPGTIQYGQWDAISHPTGHDDFLPVIIAQGKRDGPCIWLTAGIHGPEHAGPSVLYRLITQELVNELRGTIIALPALSPAGLRTKTYVPYHLPKNPNRMWPDGKPAKEQIELRRRAKFLKHEVWEVRSYKHFLHIMNSQYARLLPGA